MCHSSRTVCSALSRNSACSLMTQSVDKPRCCIFLPKSQPVYPCCRYSIAHPQAGKQTWHRCCCVAPLPFMSLGPMYMVTQHSGPPPQMPLLNAPHKHPCLLALFMSSWSTTARSSAIDISVNLHYMN